MRTSPVPAPRSRERRTRAGGRCRRGLMFIHSVLNIPFEYLLISLSNYLLESRFAGEKQVPVKEEYSNLGSRKARKLVWGMAVGARVPPTRGSEVRAEAGMGRLAKGLISAPGSRLTAGTGNELAPLAVLRVYRGRFPGKKKELQFHSPSLAPIPLLKSYPNCDAIFLSKFQAAQNLFSAVGLGFPGGSDGKEYACDERGPGSIPGLERFPGEGNGLPTPVFLPGESHGQRSLATVHGVTKSRTRPGDFHLQELIWSGGEAGRTLKDSSFSPGSSYKRSPRVHRTFRILPPRPPPRWCGTFQRPHHHRFPKPSLPDGAVSGLSWG